MIQDIYPSKLYNEYHDLAVGDEDYVLTFDKEGRIFLCNEEGRIRFLTGAEVKGDRIVYLFSLDEKKFFLALSDTPMGLSNSGASGLSDSAVSGLENMGSLPGFSFYTIREVRDQFEGKEVFAAFTAYHLWKWYSDNVYCGKCGKKLEFDKKERALRCPACDNVIYPRINPAVIVAVTKGDRILLTKYRTGYRHNALVAGFTEIGETLEETVAREVMEETGVKVKNIRYYKSQPWGMAQDILVGFFCEADGDATIHMDENELKYAEWVKREDIVLQPNNLSLTNEMMRTFKEM